MEHAIISGVAHDLSEARITVVGVADKPGVAAEVFRAVAGAEINIDTIVQNVSGATGKTDISFTLPKADQTAALQALSKVRDSLQYESLLSDEHIGKISLVGAGMRAHPGVTARFFEALAEAGVNTEAISTSEIRISILCRDTDVPAGVRALHEAFELDDDTEAVVYGGTGR
jgi:aspartate kinase